ncbi:alpha/beta hydrolase [Dysgonomonas sp. ZJ709]|uniref:alpha/beta hydrolase n=1 Tax=Dysgonomonas sp. ZJ709 TaxID=2709797 RepID=UPI0013EC990B|nr:alpha/beta hydrolase [Dysgonomonas sp. ZJ709]
MKLILNIAIWCFAVSMTAQDISLVKYTTEEDIAYIGSTTKDIYRNERCKLDVYYPTDMKDFPTIVWFHGGGLESGEKHIPKELMDKGVAVIAVSYRLSPVAKNPAYTEDAAAAVAWAFKNIASYGGSVNDIYVSGHSAGGYLALMVGLDKSFLDKYGIDADKIKGLIPISGQTNTHYTIRKERYLPIDIPIIDKYAPINHARKGIPPTLLITGDRNLEMTARYEENAHLEAILKAVGNDNVKLYELDGFDHGSVCAPGCFLMLEWIKKYSK